MRRLYENTAAHERLLVNPNPITLARKTIAVMTPESKVALPKIVSID
jgi:hypothetical protein